MILGFPRAKRGTWGSGGYHFVSIAHSISSLPCDHDLGVCTLLQCNNFSTVFTINIVDIRDSIFLMNIPSDKIFLLVLNL